MFRVAVFAVALVLIPASADERDALRVGVQADGRIVVPTNQILDPAGKQVEFPGRPVDLLLVEEGKTLVVKSMRDLLFLDAFTGRIRQKLSVTAPRGSRAGFGVVGLTALGERLLVTDVENRVLTAVRDKEGKYAWSAAFTLKAPAVGGAAYPAGVAVQDNRILVASSRGNTVSFFSPAGAIEQEIAVGVAPYMVLPVGNDRVYVTNWGGDPPRKDDGQSKTSGTPVRTDPRTGVANHGSVSVLKRTPDGWKGGLSIEVDLHPSGMCASPTGRFLYVACANSDTVCVIDTRLDRMVQSIRCRPEARLPFGSGSNAVALSPDGGTLYVANGTNNCIAVVRLNGQLREPAEPDGTASAVIGQIPVGWYPGAVKLSADGKRLYVANVKGHGALDRARRPVEEGFNSHDHLGTVSIIDVPDAQTLADYTAQANANNRLAYSLAGLEKPRPNTKPVPVPERHGEPSVIEHVIYVIKENRTYDQVFGDMNEGNGDASLCIFGAEVTPNHHKLASEFVLFDNFYCSGVLSADGHSWVNEAYVTDYLEKAFGAFVRSYPYEGSDPLAYPNTGFLWDNALAHRRTFRNYGEFCDTDYEPKGAKWSDLYADYRDGTNKVKIIATANLPTLTPYSHPTYPGFAMTTPDVVRAKIFIDELNECEKKGTFPHLTYLFLPCDHTQGTRPGAPTPRAMVADNDLALGQVVEAMSKSKFWAKTAFFVVEDDPQNGFDHVDGHRTIALVISPYTRRKVVDSTCYNQTGMVKSIELILGLPPMNQLDLSATPMRACFSDKPDLTPYFSVPNKIPLDEMNKAVALLEGRALAFARQSLEMNLDECDEADEEGLNRILWHSVRGDEVYPKDRRHLSR